MYIHFRKAVQLLRNVLAALSFTALCPGNSGFRSGQRKLGPCLDREILPVMWAEVPTSRARLANGRGGNEDR